MAAAAQNYYGLNIAWGLGTTAYSLSGVTGQYQSSDREYKVDEQEVRDQRGNVVAWVGYNPMESCTLEYVSSDSGTAYGTASISLPVIGTKINIGCDSADPISGSGWLVQSAATKRANTDAVKNTIKCVRYLAIT